MNKNILDNKEYLVKSHMNDKIDIITVLKWNVYRKERK